MAQNEGETIEHVLFPRAVSHSKILAKARMDLADCPCSGVWSRLGSEGVCQCV
jgi:hypothetical protein